jgi:hypothetical protein
MRVAIDLAITLATSRGGECDYEKQTDDQAVPHVVVKAFMAIVVTGELGSRFCSSPVEHSRLVRAGSMASAQSQCC